MNRNKY